MNTRWDKETLTEEVEHLLGFGIPAEEIATQLGLTLAGVAKATTRAGRPDLSAPFERARRKTRTSTCTVCGETCGDEALRCKPCGYRVAARKRAAKRWAA